MKIKSYQTLQYFRDIQQKAVAHLICSLHMMWYGKILARTHYATINLGLAFEIPHEHALLVFSRSGHGFRHAISLSNSVGVIDFDFTGEVKVRLECKLNVPPIITAGTAVAQAILMETPRVYFAVVDEIKEPTNKHFGFGSTGM